jgi:hypothetical protein
MSPTPLAFHFPPGVFDPVVDVVPLLTRCKRDVVLFFRGCGVDRTFLDIERRIPDQPACSKYHITRDILALNLDRSVQELLTAKIRAAAMLKDPLVYPLDEIFAAW